MPTEYAPLSSSLAEVVLVASASASLRTSSAILLALLCTAAFSLNALLIGTVVSVPRLRVLPLFLLSHVCLVGIVDLLLVVLPSLIYVANGEWTLGDAGCRINAAAQAFTSFYLCFSLAMLAFERAVGLLKREVRMFEGSRVAGLLAGTLVVSLCLSIPALTSAIPVKPYTFRYLCAVDSGGPIALPVSQAILVISSLPVVLISAGKILAGRKELRLPSQTNEYSDFIKTTRALYDHLKLGKLTIFLFCLFILTVGPYMSLCFAVEIGNSVEMLAPSPSLGSTPAASAQVDIPQDADTLITWLRFLFPLLCPIVIFSWCDDIWDSATKIFCCRSRQPLLLGNMTASNGVIYDSSNVMTLVATADGLQLKMPSSARIQPQAPPLLVPPPITAPIMQIRVPDIDDEYVTTVHKKSVIEVGKKRTEERMEVTPQPTRPKPKKAGGVRKSKVVRRKTIKR